MACSGNVEITCKSYPKCDGCNSYGTTRRNDAVDTLYYMCKLAGDVENAQCDDIRSMYPSMMFTKEGFRELYATSEKFKKMMDERIRNAILRPVTKQKIWVTTSSSVKDDEFMKKLKDGLKNPSWKHLFATIDEMHEYPADDNWLETCIKPIRSSEPRLPMTDEMRRYIKYDCEFTMKMLDKRDVLKWNYTDADKIGKVTYVKQDKEGIKVTITKNPEYKFKIKKVMFNNPATIVFWADGDKTVVKAQNGEPYDPEKGLAMAISKKALGNDRGYYNTFAKYCKKQPSEVAHADDLGEALLDNVTNRGLAADALDYLKKVVNDPKATKAQMTCAMGKAMDCMSGILENY